MILILAIKSALVFGAVALGCMVGTAFWPVPAALVAVAGIYAEVKRHD